MGRFVRKFRWCGIAGAGAALLLGLMSVEPARAVQPEEILQDPALEARAREISAGLRCLVCQNQSLADSTAPLAADLRREIRDQVALGQSETEMATTTHGSTSGCQARWRQAYRRPMARMARRYCCGSSLTPAMVLALPEIRCYRRLPISIRSCSGNWTRSDTESLRRK